MIRVCGDRSLVITSVKVIVLVKEQNKCIVYSYFSCRDYDSKNRRFCRSVAWS